MEFENGVIALGKLLIFKTYFMGIEIELYFRAGDIKTLATNGTPFSILVNTTTVIDPTTSTPVVIAFANGYDTHGNIIGNRIFGCPTPCHPTEDSACIGTSDTLLQNYIDKKLFAGL